MTEMYVRNGFNFCLSSSLEINKPKRTSVVPLLYLKIISFSPSTILKLVHQSKQAAAQNLKHQQDALKYRHFACFIFSLETSSVETPPCRRF